MSIEEAVAKAVAERYAKVEFADDSSAVIRVRRPMPVAAHAALGVLAVVLLYFGNAFFALALVAVWVVLLTRSDRYRLTVDEAGNVTELRL